jgi:hypothetical protein
MTKSITIKNLTRRKGKNYVIQTQLNQKFTHYALTTRKLGNTSSQTLAFTDRTKYLN